MTIDGDCDSGCLSTLSDKVETALERLLRTGFAFDGKVAFDLREAALFFNSATLWKVFGLGEILAREQPTTVRGGMYRGIPKLFADSGERHYDCCMRLILKMRRERLIPFSYIADNTRNRRKPSSWSGLADYADTVAECYRKDFWESQSDYIEFFVEKDAMAGVIEPVTEEYDVHLLPIRGDCSETLVQRIGEEWKRIEKPIFAYYFGDHDPKGFTIERSFRKRVEGYAQKTVAWTRLGVTHEDFLNEGILGFELKKNSKTTGQWKPYQDQYGDRCIEVDAISANEIRDRARRAIESHINQHEWRLMKLIEAEEKKDLLAKIRRLGQRQNR
jgi:hypothetical protein